MDRVRTSNDRAFWAGLAGASLLHAALIFGASSSTPRQVGEKDGLMEAISIELLEPEALAGNTGPQEGETSPEQGSNSALQLPRPESKANSWQTDTAPDKPETPASEAKPQQQAMLALPDPEAKEAQAEQKEPQKEQKEPQKETTQKETPPKETQKEAKKESQKNAAPKAPTTKDKQASTQLDFSMPSSLFNAPVGGGANAVMRPDGITRSGENDDFGRDVVRALRKTMPAHEKIFGRLTVRILLSPNGDVVEIQLLKGSGNSYLDQIVMFSARQAVYPFPPKGATSIDRTFVVTYIYS